MDMMLIKNVVLDGERRNVLIEGERYKDLNAPETVSGAAELDANGMAILPAFYNMHCHAPMYMMRGLGDDRKLQDWLNNFVFPYEAKMTEQEKIDALKMAIDEMKRTGTVGVNDTYYYPDSAMDILSASGMRAILAYCFVDAQSAELQQSYMKMVDKYLANGVKNVQMALGPHAIYTISPDNLKKWAAAARSRGIRLHMHLAETQKEVDDCIKANGCRPVELLERIGFLADDVIVAHCVYANAEEWKILADRGATVVHCPCSNMKLGSGRFPYELAIASGCRITLGTDGVGSNNNLDMREEMKFAALLAKVAGDPTLLPAEQIFTWATRNGAEAMGVDAGVVEVGKLADCILVDCNNFKMKPCRSLLSNFVYSADSSCIKHTICGGKVI